MTISENELSVSVPPSTGSLAALSVPGSDEFSVGVLFSGAGVLEAVLSVLQPVNKIPTSDKISKTDHNLLLLPMMQ